MCTVLLCSRFLPCFLYDLYQFAEVVISPSCHFSLSPRGDDLDEFYCIVQCRVCENETLPAIKQLRKTTLYRNSQKIRLIN